MRDFYDKFIESYYHYRDRCGCGKLRAVYRAFYYEIRGKEPNEKRNKKLMDEYWRN